MTDQPIDYNTALSKPINEPAPDTANISGMKATVDPFAMMTSQSENIAAKGKADLQTTDQQAQVELDAKQRAWDQAGGHGEAKRGTPDYYKAMIDDAGFMSGLSPAAAKKVHEEYIKTKMADAALDKTLTEMEDKKLEHGVKQATMTAQLYGDTPLDIYNQSMDANKGKPDAEAIALKAMHAAMMAGAAQAAEHPEWGVKVWTASDIEKVKPETLMNMLGVLEHVSAKSAAALEAKVKQAEIKKYTEEASKDAATAYKEEGLGDKARAEAEAKRYGIQNPTEKHEYQSKTNLLVDGMPAEVAFDTKTKTYWVGDEQIDPKRISTAERGGVTPAQAATVQTDIFEVKKFLDKTNPKDTASLFFGDKGDEGAFARFTKNELKSSEKRQYDVYANRLANSIVGMQSFGRYRGAIKSIDEARKLVPVPGDDEATIKTKRDYIKSLAVNSETNLFELSPPNHRLKRQFGEEPAKTEKPVTSSEPPADQVKLKSLGWTWEQKSDGTYGWKKPR